LASLLPDARFVTLESDNHILQEGEPAWDAFLSEVRAFLGDDELAPTDAGDIGELSDREREVLELVAAGMSNEQRAVPTAIWVSELVPLASLQERICFHCVVTQERS
jgi:hypothetical protein